VLAKLDAAAMAPLVPADFPDACEPQDVARMAAADLTALINARQA